MGKNTNRAGRLFPRNRMEHWHKIVIWLVIYDCIAVNISYFAALWLRFDCRISMIPAYYLQAFWSFAPYYSVSSIGIFGMTRLY